MLGIGVDLYLIAVDAVGGDGNLFAVPQDFTGGGQATAADLHAGVELGIDLEFIFEDEIRVSATGAEEGVRRAGSGGADDATVLDGILGCAAALDPAVEVFAVEESRPAIVGHGNGGCRKQQEGGAEVIHGFSLFEI